MMEITAEIRALIDKAAAGVELAEDEYIDPSDGLIHCKKCGGQRQTVVPCFGKSGYFMPHCICQCQQEAEEQRKEDMKMLYTEKEKNEIERVRKVFEKHIQQMTAYDLVWSDKVGYVWLAISIDPVYIDTGNWIESAAGLCYECLNDIALDVFGMTGNDHDFEDADPLELAEIKRRWKPYIGQLPEYAYLCDELLSRSK